jgi:5'-nucleotidase|tara:strand:- start:684 stop:1580 length:897 start_codon:yes stop_codon:yes gene_type:complete
MTNTKLVIAISSRALFDLTESHGVFENKGLGEYRKYQVENEKIPLGPGPAFNLIQKLVSLNKNNPEAPIVEVVLLSRNSADTGLRIFNSIKTHDLGVVRAVFTSGKSPYKYISPLEADLFLSTDSEDVQKALDSGFAAATLLPSKLSKESSDQLKIAFDGDAVIFSDEAEKIFQEKGLKAFEDSEKGSADNPLQGGPFARFLQSLHEIQKAYPEGEIPIQTALVTARGAPAHERVIKTLRAWDIRIDEALFLGGKEKGPFLEAFGADIFFDDQRKHCDSARNHVATGHVPYGVKNKNK